MLASKTVQCVRIVLKDLMDAARLLLAAFGLDQASRT